MISEFCLFVESLRGTLPIFSLSSFTFTAALSENQLTFFFPPETQSISQVPFLDNHAGQFMIV